MSANTSVSQRRRFWYHGWNIVAVAILSQVAANGMPVNAFSLFLRDWSAELHAPISTLQLGLAALGLGSAVLSPICGMLADKYPARWLLIFGLVGLVVLHIGLSFVTTTWQFLAFFAFVLPVSLVFASAVPANSAIAKWFVRSRGLALGLSAFGIGVAGVVLPPIIAALEPMLGWRTLWRIAGLIIALAVIPAVFFVIRDRPTERDGLDYLTGESHAISHHGASESDGRTRWRDVLTRKNFWLLIFAYLPMLALYGGCANNVAPIAESEGLSQQTAGILLSALSFAQLAASLSVGLLSDRFGNRLPFFGLAMTSAIGGLIVAFGQGLPSLGVGMVFVGMGAGFWPLLSSALAAEFGSGAFGRAFGTATMFIPLIALAPFTVAKIHEVTGGYAPGVAAITVLVFLGGSGCLFLREQRREKSGNGEEAARF